MQVTVIEAMGWALNSYFCTPAGQELCESDEDPHYAGIVAIFGEAWPDTIGKESVEGEIPDHWPNTQSVYDAVVSACEAYDNMAGM